MRLLVIEDYAPLREALTRGLRDAGYAVDATGSGMDGVWYANNHPYDAVLLDIMLPGVDGFALLRRLRGAGNATRVLVLTARDAVADRVTGLDLGADRNPIRRRCEALTVVSFPLLTEPRARRLHSRSCVTINPG